MEQFEEPSQARDQAGKPSAFQLSRRALLRGSSAVTLAAGVAVVADEDAHAQEGSPPTAMRSPQHAQINTASSNAGAPLLPGTAVIALSRMGFGATAAQRDEFRALGNTDEARLQAYVEQQLVPASIDDSACDEKLAAHGFTTLSKSLAQLWADHVKGDAGRSLPAEEVEKAAFIRAIHSKRQLKELLANYWHDHFNVYAWDYSISPVFVHYDRDVIRKHLLGNFRQMLEAVAQSPAMLYYLDNQSNSGDRPNENYARELFELHVMGAENYLGVRSVEDPTLNDADGKRIGYIDEDVYGATTCFTGWRVNTDTGAFAFDESAHFPYAKEVLGVRIPSNQGIQDGKQVLDLLAFHPGSARYICRRLCRSLISDNPPERIVQEAADLFIANKNAPDQLKIVVRAILLSPEFRNTWGEKIKRPFDYSVGILRALLGDYTPANDFFWNYDGIGQALFSWRPPDGYPDDIEAWSGTMPMLQRWRHCNWLFNWKIGGEGADAETYRLRPEVQTPGNLTTSVQLVDYWSRRILGQLLPDSERQSIIDFMASGRNPEFDLPADQIAERLRQMVALICLSPSFQWR